MLLETRLVTYEWHEGVLYEGETKFDSERTEVPRLTVSLRDGKPVSIHITDARPGNTLGSWRVYAAFIKECDDIVDSFMSGSS